MNHKTITLIRDELLTDSLSFPILTVYKLTRLYVNKELVAFIKKLLIETKTLSERERILLQLKKLIKQEVREPHQNQVEADKAEFAQYFKDIEDEQKFYEPVKWIDAELKYIKCLQEISLAQFDKKLALEQKEWLSRNEMLLLFDTSKSTLDRMVEDGLKPGLFGVKQIFNCKEVYAWIRARGGGASNIDLEQVQPSYKLGKKGKGA